MRQRARSLQNLGRNPNHIAVRVVRWCRGRLIIFDAQRRNQFVTIQKTLASGPGRSAPNFGTSFFSLVPHRCRTRRYVPQETSMGTLAILKVAHRISLAKNTQNAQIRTHPHLDKYAKKMWRNCGKMPFFLNFFRYLPNFSSLNCANKKARSNPPERALPLPRPVIVRPTKNLSLHSEHSYCRAVRPRQKFCCQEEKKGGGRCPELTIQMKMLIRRHHGKRSRD